jgi:hypothetical protein
MELHRLRRVHCKQCDEAIEVGEFSAAPLFHERVAFFEGAHHDHQLAYTGFVAMTPISAVKLKRH